MLVPPVSSPLVSGFLTGVLIIFRFQKFSYVLYVGCLERNLVWGKSIRALITGKFFRLSILAIKYFYQFIFFIENNREKEIIIDELKFYLFMEKKIYDSLKL